MTLDRLDIVAHKGVVKVPQMGPLSIDGSSFSIVDFLPDIPDAQIKLRATGNVKAALGLLDSDPLNILDETDFDTARATGRADIRVMLDLPLAEDLRFEDVQFDAPR